MKHALTCQFCKAPITVTISDDYSNQGDPFKLLPFAACNHCADLRVTRRKVEDSIGRVCGHLLAMKRPDREPMRDALERLTKAYSRMIADWVKATAPAWDAAGVDLMLDRPDAWPNVLQQYWRMYQ